jgi:hypothetical protein
MRFSTFASLSLAVLSSALAEPAPEAIITPAARGPTGMALEDRQRECECEDRAASPVAARRLAFSNLLVPSVAALLSVTPRAARSEREFHAAATSRDETCRNVTVQPQVPN